jgi:hypothetical protein
MGVEVCDNIRVFKEVLCLLGSATTMVMGLVPPAVTGIIPGVQAATAGVLQAVTGIILGVQAAAAADGAPPAVTGIPPGVQEGAILIPATATQHTHD